MSCFERLLSRYNSRFILWSYSATTMSTKAVIPTTTSQGSPANYEDTHVHSVYNSIADHFSSTRYKPWPVVAAFLASMPPGSVGLDAGCGNGKYLIAPKEREGSYWTIGLDRSARLLEIAKRAGDRDRECIVGDVLDIPWRNGIFVGTSSQIDCYTNSYDCFSGFCYLHRNYSSPFHA